MKLWLLLFIFMSACTVTPTNPTPPQEKPVVDQPIHTLPVPSGDLPTIKNNMDNAMLTKIVTGSSCAAHSFGNRGKPNLGFLKGLLTGYARTLCYYNSPYKTYAGTIGKELGAESKDVLAHYGLKSSNGGQRIKQTYTILIGLAARESSFQYGTGWDRGKLKGSNPITPSAANSETGLFQVSYDNNKSMPDSAAIYEIYKAHPERCALDVFKEGARSVDEGFIGSGPGYDFQKFMRYCPALQVDYVAPGVRVNVPQWGPLKRNEAEYFQGCEDMLSKVEVALVCN